MCACWIFLKRKLKIGSSFLSLFKDLDQLHNLQSAFARLRMRLAAPIRVRRWDHRQLRRSFLFLARWLPPLLSPPMGEIPTLPALRLVSWRGLHPFSLT
jgi:hypothetical protein